MPKLTDSQLVILNGATQRKNGAVLPLPKSLKLNKAAATMVLKSLVTRGLVEEQPAARDDAAWREAGDQRFALRLSKTGAEAIGAEDQGGSGTSAAAAQHRSKKTKASSSGGGAKKKEVAGVRPGTKLGLMIEMLGRKAGATIDEIVKATGWQSHSVRGAISGSLKKKLGMTVTSETVKGRGRVYRCGRS